ncbi:MAG: phosphate acetyltransferase [Buchnera aphidicola (Pentalonia nigronervosa)]|uniref:Phosphate acetyltransferase n=1 Tax=Buchnera aphidicola (Pentalonia nigronervosa) TaxID=1309793 RepID=A0A7H1AZJ6_9GAMM|nr:MAG: phosphate acetyltransferase [Buchnera aphidicola (Pentalonia nigronervosa)]
MSRIIMLIPVDHDVGLTAISLSLIDIFSKNVIKKNNYAPILYCSCENHFLNSAPIIINKYFSDMVSILEYIDFSSELFNSAKYFFSLDKIIKECHKKKNIHELILITGLKSHNNIYAEQINYDIAQNISAEVIFVINLKNTSLKYALKKENQIKIFLERKKYKNVLGVVINNINSPFLEKKYCFTQKLIYLKKIRNNYKINYVKKTCFEQNVVPIIAQIPWNKCFLKISLTDIKKMLDATVIGCRKKFNRIITEIYFFNQEFQNMLQVFHSGCLIILSWNQIDFFINTFCFNLKNSIGGILLFNSFKTDICFLQKKCQFFIHNHIPILFIQKNVINLVTKLQMMNFDLFTKNKKYIKKLQTYISRFFSDSFKKCSLKNTTRKAMFSPREFCHYLESMSRTKNKRIILPESYEERILQAASICYRLNIAQCVLLGDPKKIYSIAHHKGIQLSKNIEIINPYLVRNSYIKRFMDLRKNKNLDELSAIKKLQDNIMLATLILESNKVDGLVSGSINTTANTVRPALQIIKTDLQNSLVSSIFFMLLPNQVLIYGDCAININPTAEELATIAIQSADSAKIFGIEPRIAMLSYSTGYSGCGDLVEKIRLATMIVKKKRSDLIIDGPIQYDAAVSDTVFKLKIPNSPIFGSATVFIFPDLNAGNIAYKAVQRSADILALGPMLQGLKKPVNDLSRGASVRDIIYTIALTSIQCI